MEGLVFFLSGFCPPSIRADGGTMRTKFWQNYFFGKGFAKTSAEFSRPQKGVWGMNAGGIRFYFFRKKFCAY